MTDKWIKSEKLENNERELQPITLEMLDGDKDDYVAHENSGTDNRNYKRTFQFRSKYSSKTDSCSIFPCFF
jgi:hypothetical protein